MGSIYKITNTVNGKSYIGQTIRDAEKTRIPVHLNGHGNVSIKQAIEKYGKDAFTYEILHDGIIPELLDALESEAIKKFNTVFPHGYNLTTGGGGTHSEETRQKISNANKGRTAWNKGKRGILQPSEETCLKISEALTGITRSKETRRKISEGLKGHPCYKNRTAWNKGKSPSEETRRKQSEAKKGKKRPPFTDETRRKLSEANKGEKNHFYGKTLSQEHRRKLSKAITGEKHSSESKQKMSEVRESAECKSAHTIFFSCHQIWT